MSGLCAQDWNRTSTPCGRQILSLLRLPIPPPGLCTKELPLQPSISTFLNGVQYYIIHPISPKYDANIFSCNNTLSALAIHPL